jgi:hypothetical protein
MRPSPTPLRSKRDQTLEQRVTYNVIMTPWVWALSPAWAMWVEPPPPPRGRRDAMNPPARR